MATKVKSAIFLGVVFGISWPILIGSWLSGHRNPGENGLLLLAFAASPGLSAMLCTIAFERARWREALGIRFRPNIWWLWAILIPLLTTLVTIVLTSLLGPYQISGTNAVVAEAAKVMRFPAAQGLSGLASHMALMLAGYSILFSLTEELAWRGYLYSLWRPFGFWRTALATGFIWGVWHWPMIYLYGANYPNAPVIGVGVFPIYTMLTACLFTVVRDRSGSVWAAGIMHGAMNTFSVLFLFSFGDFGWPWGVAGIGGILAAALAVLVVGRWYRGDSDGATSGLYGQRAEQKIPPER